MSALLRDLAFAWRAARRRPVISLLIVVTLALGIGANTAMFSVAYRVLLAPLPYTDGERLVRLEQNGMEFFPSDAPWSDPTLDDYRRQNTVFSHLVEYTQNIFTLVGQGDPYQANVGIVSHDFFAMLGVLPQVGRGFVPEDAAEGAQATLLLSDALWRSRFNADPAVVGRTLEMGNILYQVIGVVPQLPPWPHANDVWILPGSDPFRVFTVVDVKTNRANGYILYVYGKLQEGVSLAAASADMTAVAARLVQQYPDVYTQSYSLTLKPLQAEMVGDSGTTLTLLAGLAFLVMLIASANVANLQLAGTMSRSQEMAIREAVGANPGHIRQQVLTQSMLFALAGGALGLGIVQASVGVLGAFVSRYTPLADTLSMDVSVLLIALAAALGTGLFSAALAFSRRPDISKVLKEGGDKVTVSSTGRWRRQLLLLTQFSLAFVVLTSSALMGLSLLRLSQQHTGYESEGVLELSMLMNMDLGASFPERQAHLQHFGDQLRARAEALPGVQASGFFGGAPLLQDASWLRPALFEVSQPAEAVQAPILSTRINFVSVGWFEVMGIPLVRGRLFNDSDAGAKPVAIVNASLAERYFPDGDAVGGVIRYAGTEFELAIVGVVENFRSRNLGVHDEPAVYFYRQAPSDALNFFVKSSGNLDQLTERLTNIVHELDPRQSVMRAQSLEQTTSAWLGPLRLRTLLICLFGALALVVTLSGVVGVVSYDISQRVREIGVHMAVGADPGKVTGLFVMHGLKTLVGGLVLGLLLALGAAPLLEPLLYETSVFSPVPHLAVGLLLTCVVLLALYLSARRAGALSPMEALHAE